jgi:hypothetical protein
LTGCFTNRQSDNGSGQQFSEVRMANLLVLLPTLFQLARQISDNGILAELVGWLEILVKISNYCDLKFKV